MKTLITNLLMIFSLFFCCLSTACTDEEKNNKTDERTMFKLSSDFLDLSLDPLNVEVGTSGKSYEIAVEAGEGVTWQVEVKEGNDFIDVEPAEIKTGNGVIKINVPENQTKEEKKAVVVISSMTNDPKEVSFVQEGLSEYSSAHFAVMADLHYGNNKYKEGTIEKIRRALDFIKQERPELKALFVCGDFADGGLEEEYREVTQLIKENLPADVKVYYMLGNHDKYAGEQSLMAYKTIVNQPYHQYIEKNGYPYITISTALDKHKDACYDDGAVEFLRKSLRDATQKYEGKPIFVFSHSPSDETPWGPAWGYADLHRVLKSYPQVIHFTGHTHYTIEDERSIWQNSYTWINVGPSNSANVSMDVTTADDQYPQSGGTINEALLVDVDGNMDVTVTRLDTYSKKKLEDAWIIRAPHNGTLFRYNNKPGMEGMKERPGNGGKPTMDEAPVVSEISEYTCKVTFKQGNDDSFVWHYIIEVINKGTNKVDYSRKLFSDFYWRHEGEPQTLTHAIAGLQPGTDYKVSIRAVDSFFSESEPAVAEFATKELVVDPDNALKADLIDVVFNNKGAVNAVKGIGLNVNSSDNGTPVTEYNDNLKMYVGKFAGQAGNNAHYVIDYSSNNVYKEGISDGFSWEVYCSSSDIASEQYIIASHGNGGMMISLNYPWTSNLGEGAKSKTICAVMAKTASWGAENIGYQFISPESVKFGTYYHLLFAWDKVNLKLYLNGKLIATKNMADLILFGKTQSLFVGGLNAGNWGRFMGDIAIARVYNRPLPEEDVAAIYEQITKRAEMTGFSELNDLLVSGTLSSEKAEEGWALMNSLTTTQEEVNAFISGVSN